MMRPAPAFFMCGTVSRVSLTVPMRLRLYAPIQSSSLKASKVPNGGPPALFTTTSTRPKASTLLSTKFRISSYLDMSRHRGQDVSPGFRADLLRGPAPGLRRLWRRCLPWRLRGRNPRQWPRPIP